MHPVLFITNNRNSFKVGCTIHFEPEFRSFLCFDEGTQWFFITGEIEVDFVGGRNSASIVHTFNDSFPREILTVHAAITGMLRNMIGTGKDS